MLIGKEVRLFSITYIGTNATEYQIINLCNYDFMKFEMEYCDTRLNDFSG